MKNEELIDYAYPLMMAENALKGCYKAALAQEYDVATEVAMNAMAEIKLTITALKHMQEQKNALREQAETI